jgi:hypothetical protein
MSTTPWKSRKPTPEKSSTKRRWIIAAVLLLLGGGALAGWRYAYPPEDPQVAKVKALQQQLFRSMDSQRTATSSQPVSTTNISTTATQPVLSPQEREAAMTQLRAEMDKLTEEQRDAIRRDMGNSFRERMRATIKEYRALPKEKRAAFLDKQIDEWEKRRAEFQRGGGPGGPGGNAQRGGGNTGASNNNNRGGDGRRQGGDRGPPSPERRLEWRRNMLAETTPEERAEAEMYFSDMNDRREARGLEPMGPGPRR